MLLFLKQKERQQQLCNRQQQMKLCSKKISFKKDKCCSVNFIIQFYEKIAYLLEVPDIPLSFFFRKNKLDLSFFLLLLRESSSSKLGLKFFKINYIIELI